MTQDRRAVQARIAGHVQGVGFRAWTRSEARNLGLTGWVRNEADGSVIALLVGPDPAVSTLVERLRMGPPGAFVSGVTIEDADPAEAPPDFRIAG